MIVLATIDAQKFSLDGRAIYKGTLELRPGLYGTTYRIWENGEEQTDYGDVYFGDFVDGDNANTPFASPGALEEYQDKVIRVFLPFPVPVKVVSTASANFALIKSGKALLHQLTAINTAESVRYLKIYDKDSAPTAGDVALLTIPIYNKTDKEILQLLPKSLQLYKGLAIGITGGLDDADETAIGANEVVVNMIYQ